ncbi:MAG TPA: flavodoxin family protein [Methanomicrobiales archaeon]|nr:flavodoxin family protein [Methanomicrobiales archaeon]
MPTVMVVYLSHTGNTEKMAQAVAEGAGQAGAEVVVKKAGLVKISELVAADAIAFGSATSWGYMGGKLKDVFENMLIEARDKFSGKPFAVFVSAGIIESGKKAAESIGYIAGYFHMQVAAGAVVSQGSPTEKDLETSRELGRTLARAIR